MLKKETFSIRNGIRIKIGHQKIDRHYILYSKGMQEFVVRTFLTDWMKIKIIIR